MLAEPSAGLGVDAGDERRILEGTTPMSCYKFPSLWSSPVTGAGAASHSFVDHRHDGVRPRSNGLNQEDRPRLRRATAFAELASNRVRRSRGLGRSETADLVVSEPVEDEREELSGHRNPGLGAPPALGDPVVVGAELLVALGPVVADRLDGPPAHQSGSLLGDRHPVDRLVGLTVLGGEPGPRAELLGALEAGDVADLGHEDGGQDLADAWELQEGPVAWVVLQLFVHIAVEHGDLTVVELQEVPEGLDPDRGRPSGDPSRPTGHSRSGPTSRPPPAGSRSWPSPRGSGPWRSCGAGPRRTGSGPALGAPSSRAGRSNPRPDGPGGAWRRGPGRRVRRSSPGGPPSCCARGEPDARWHPFLSAGPPPSTSHRWIPRPLRGPRRPFPWPERARRAGSGSAQCPAPRHLRPSGRWSTFGGAGRFPRTVVP